MGVFCSKEGLRPVYMESHLRRGCRLPNRLLLYECTDAEWQISTCVGFAALAKADMKFSKGLRFTGVGAVSCTRSEFVMTVGNLHKGERYSLCYIS